MAYKRLWILVEGNDDERFIEKIKPAVEKKYDSVQSWQYAQEPAKRTKNFLKSIKSMKSECFFWMDINEHPCVTAKKKDIKKIYRKRLDPDSIVVIIKEIESWYLAGLDDRACRNLGIHSLPRTDHITKEQFNRLIPKKYDSRIDFMVEILKKFSVETAKRKNRSFNYFMAKL